MGISEIPITLGGRLWKNCRRPSGPPWLWLLWRSSLPLCSVFHWGVLSASRKGGLADRSIYLFGIICMSLPNYWIGFMLLLAFAVYIPIFSIMGADSLKDFVLPALALAIPMAAGNIRVFRSSLLDGYNSDFVLYARARGVSEWKIANLVRPVCPAGR